MSSLLGADQSSYIQELRPKFEVLHFYPPFISDTRGVCGGLLEPIPAHFLSCCAKFSKIQHVELYVRGHRFAPSNSDSTSSLCADFMFLLCFC